MIDESRRRQQTFVLGALAVILVAAYFRPLLFGDTFALRDHLTLVVPARAHLAESLRAGMIPEWWDGVGLGVPFAANPMHGGTYPPLPVGFGADLLIVLHILLLGAGTAMLARRIGADPIGAVVAGGAMMCCGYTASMTVNGIPLLTMAWTPWVAWAADRIAARPGLATGAVAAAMSGAQIMSGDPAGVVTASLLGGAWVLLRADRKPWCLGVFAAAQLGALVLAAVTILPALALLSDSQRAGGLSTEAAGAWSMHPARLLEWIWPNAFGDPTEPARDLAGVYLSSSADPNMGPTWSLSLFIGAPVLILAGYAAHRSQARLRGVLIASLGFVVLALGTYTALYAVYRAVVLPEWLIRFPERHLVGAIVIWCALAGAGFTRVFAHSPARWLWKGTAIGACGLATLAAGAMVLRGTVVDAVGDRLDADGAWDAVLSGGFTAAIVLGVVALAFGMARTERYASAAPALAAAAIVGHLIGQGWSTLPLVDRADVSELAPLLTPLADELGSPRPRLYRHRSMAPSGDRESSAALVVALYESAVANTATRFGVAYVPGYDPASTQRLKQLWEAGARYGPRLLDLYDIEYRVMRRLDDGRLGIAQQGIHRPRAFVASRWAWFADDVAVHASLFGPAFDRTLVRLVGSGDAAAVDSPAELRPCSIDSYESTRVTMRCTADRPGYAVLLDAWSPGWSATVDGESAAIERADVVVRAVRIDAGDHVLTFSYRTPGLRIGAVLSLLGWLNLAVLWFVLRRSRTSVRTE